MNLLILTFFIAELITGCASVRGPVNGYVTAMERSSGKTYRGTVVVDGISKAMNITINGVNYTGAFVVSESNNSTAIGRGFASSTGNASVSGYGNGGRYVSGYGQGSSFRSGTAVSSTIAGTRYVKGIFISPNGRGLRCESTATGHGGAGVCIDYKGEVYDIVVIMP